MAADAALFFTGVTKFESLEVRHYTLNGVEICSAHQGIAAPHMFIEIPNDRDGSTKRCFVGQLNDSETAAVLFNEWLIRQVQPISLSSRLTEADYKFIRDTLYRGESELLLSTVEELNKPPKSKWWPIKMPE